LLILSTLYPLSKGRGRILLKELRQSLNKTGKITLGVLDNRNIFLIVNGL
jgi:hypothetical protein